MDKVSVPHPKPFDTFEHYTLREKLRALLNIRLGVDALEKTKLNLNTNKNEAANRGLSASLPKNVKFSRNCTARSYAAVHR